MLTKFDDYPIHQTPDPIAHPASSDKDVYERYWFNGYSTVGDMYLGIGTAYYPHLGIQDCGISVVHEGRQYAFHASARATPEPSELRVGPFNIEILEPMRTLRVALEANETDFTGRLLPPNEEAVNGRDAIREYWVGFIASGIDSIDLTTVEVFSVDDTATQISNWTVSVDGQVVDSGRATIVWAKVGDEWLYHRDMWSSDRPVPTASN